MPRHMNQAMRPERWRQTILRRRNVHQWSKIRQQLEGEGFGRCPDDAHDILRALAAFAFGDWPVVGAGFPS